MARILMAWELGAGRGHIAPLLSLARPLKAAGHEIVFAVRDPGDVGPYVQEAGFVFFQAPVHINAETGKLFSYAQILLNVGFGDAGLLRGRAQAWRALYAQVRPDLLISDHSPTALFAARGLPFKTLTVGTGFFLPPDNIAPLPNLRPWAPVEPTVLERDEAQLLEIMNVVLRTWGAAPLQRAAEINRADAQALFTLKELDNYADCRTAEYWGPVPASGGAKPEWPQVPGQRIFVYLRPFDTLPALLDILRNLAQPTLIYTPRPGELRGYETSSLKFADTPLDMQYVTRECDLAILHGGHGALSALLLAGKPMLCLPMQLEMLLNSEAMARTGAGLVAPEHKPEGMRRKLERLLKEPDFGTSARAFAERYTGLNVQAIPERFAALTEKVLAA